MSELSTWMACLTPPGQGALATLGLCGPAAWQAARAVFRPRRGTLPSVPGPGRFWLGSMGDEVADAVVLAVRRIDPQPLLEIHSHGGREIVGFLSRLLLKQGVQPCSWEAFLQQIGDDPLRSRAAVALAHAPTYRTASILLDQHNGALGRELDAILAYLQAQDGEQAQRLLVELAGRSSVGLHLTQPWRVVVAGAPNVGKSSLVNALVGYQRSIVCETPGTTRDLVRTRIAIDGWPVELIDTAGLRAEGSELEEAGMEQARAAADGADLCLWILDAATGPVWPDVSIDGLRLVINKVDLAPAWDLGQVRDVVQVSARTGHGLQALCAALSGWLVAKGPPPGAGVPFSVAMIAPIEQAQRLLAAGCHAQASFVLEALRHGREAAASVPT